MSENVRSIESKLASVITLDALKKFAVAAGDPNPIHQDESVAQSMGLPGVIAHGMLISSLVVSRALGLIEKQPEFSGKRISRTENRFRAMTFLGDEISVSGQWEKLPSGQIQLDLVAKNQREDTVLTMQAQLA